MGLRRDGHGLWIVFAGFVLAVPIFANMLIQFRAERVAGEPSQRYSRWGTFELEDTIYLVGPIVWIGGLYLFFLAGCAGTLIAYTIGIYGLASRIRRE